MLYYIIRLDDACPGMNTIKWNQIEQLLDKYEIKPIVGIIPEARDWCCEMQVIKSFWNEIAIRYQEKGWIIAQHGCYHKSITGNNSEFKGLTYREQMELIMTGNRLMRERGIKPEVFFAPKHSFDDVTVDVCRDSDLFRFISDGQALLPYSYRGMLFYPCLFDTPHAVLSCGIFTFVFHPDHMDENMLNKLENFILKHRDKFADIDEIDNKINKQRKRNLLDYLLGFGINVFRKIRPACNENCFSIFYFI